MPAGAIVDLRPAALSATQRAAGARPFGLVATSYGYVFGWLDGAGLDLYIADGINLRDYAYRLDSSAAGRPTGDDARGPRRRTIAEVYKFTPPN